MNVDQEDIPEITISEIYATLKQMKNRNASGEDNISCKMLKNGGPTLIHVLKLLFNISLDKGKISKDWHEVYSLTYINY